MRTYGVSAFEELYFCTLISTCHCKKNMYTTRDESIYISNLSNILFVN
jgi:hypothetical protein